MCCDTCPNYDECADKDKLKEECCKRCPEHGYCVGVGEEGHENYAEDGLGDYN